MNTWWGMYGEGIENSLEIANGLQMDGKWCAARKRIHVLGNPVEVY